VVIAMPMSIGGMIETARRPHNRSDETTLTQPLADWRVRRLACKIRMPPTEQYDVLIIGAGPAGSTAAILLARAGLRALVLEKSTFPRFHIGESLLPRNFPLIQQLGLEPQLRKLPHVPKFGVEFAMGDGSKSAKFSFDNGLIPGSETVSLERAPFDAMLLNTARESGAEVREGVTVRRILKLEDGNISIDVDGQPITGRWVIDASGQGTIVGRHLGTRTVNANRHLQKVAYFAHFENVKRAPGREGGYPVIVLCQEGWFWLIPLDETRTSVGLVLDAQVARNLDVPADHTLSWGIENCPEMRNRMRQATGPETNQAAADFSYSCRPFAGPGYFLAGDAAAFLDPMFSTGVCLAMVEAENAATQIIAILRSQRHVNVARREYAQFVEGSTSIFFRLIREYYDHSFRELFLNGTGPLGVHAAILSILAGQVFPRPAFSLRWRLQLFFLLQRLNRHVPLVPRRQPFSLLAEEKRRTVRRDSNAKVPTEVA
jgi:flavin-dependent dehydrogenase